MSCTRVSEFGRMASPFMNFMSGVSPFIKPFQLVVVAGVRATHIYRDSRKRDTNGVGKTARLTGEDSGLLLRTGGRVKKNGGRKNSGEKMQKHQGK